MKKNKRNAKRYSSMKWQYVYASKGNRQAFKTQRFHANYLKKEGKK